ncbi:MAG: cytochrome c oxidase subunit II [Brevinematia bacterium]
MWELISKMLLPFLNSFQTASPKQYWLNSYFIWFVASAILFVGVLILGLYFIIRYRYVKGKNEEGAHIEGNTFLEIIWIVVPTILAIFLATFSFANFMYQRSLPMDGIEIKVTAFMWGWEVEYPNGKVIVTSFDPNNPYDKTEEEKFYLPVGEKIKVFLTSRDVIHSFYVQPAMITEDAVPGRITYMWFKVDYEGEYYAFCREYCGTWHSGMVAVLKFVDKDEFEEWLKN